MKINLTEQGVFPITKDKNGTDIKNLPDTSYNHPGTLQGEGGLMGTPCLFIRLSGCNLRCAWVGANGDGSPCDTPYSSHAPETNKMKIEDVVATVAQNMGNMKHIVISGGEPTLQMKALIELCHQLNNENPKWHITVETNGTKFDAHLADAIDLVSLSPKLASSTPWTTNLKNTGIEFDDKWAKIHERKRRNLKALRSWQEGNCDYQYKFVVSKMEDLDEIENDFRKRTWPSYDKLFLMPEGVTPEDLMTTSKWVASEAIKRGWRFSIRLHALLWGIARGV